MAMYPAERLIYVFLDNAKLGYAFNRSWRFCAMADLAQAGPRLAGRDEILIPHRPMSNSQFQYPVEQHSAAPGVAAVEAEHELVQVAGQVCRVHGSLVSAQQPSLGQGGDPMNTRQNFARILIPRHGRTLDAPFMEVSLLFQPPG